MELLTLRPIVLSNYIEEFFLSLNQRLAIAHNPQSCIYASNSLKQLTARSIHHGRRQDGDLLKRHHLDPVFRTKGGQKGLPLVHLLRQRLR
jgi:hypothetical protein